VLIFNTQLTIHVYTFIIDEGAHLNNTN